MRRRKRFTIRRIILGLAVVTILAPVAQAKPTPGKHPMQTEIPYLSHGTLTPPDSSRTSDQLSVTLGPGEIPSVSDGTLRIGPGEVPSFDDGVVRPPAKPGSDVTSSATTADDGGYDIGFGIVSSAVIVLLLALGGAALAIRHSRKTRLSPA
jgi:hypothetical protein